LEIKLSFLGATRNVTGSRYLLEANGSKILIDCGIYQERDFRHRNWDTFPVPPDSLDSVLLTHAHLDHCGLIPKLVRDGFKGRIYCTDATYDITQIMLLDSAKIQMEDAEFKRRRHKSEGREGKYPEIPLYTEDDAEASFHLFSTVDYREPVDIGDGLSATFYDAGHVLGSSMIKITVSDHGKNRTILFSGDVGRRNKPILRDPTVFSEADYVIVESTYGDRVHGSSADIADHLADVVNSTQKAGGNIIVPSFALERAQEVLYYLNRLVMENRIPHLVVFMDSPMAVRITRVFESHPEMFDKEMTKLVNGDNSPFGFRGLRMVGSVEESKAINHITGTVMVIAGSGMCTGGRIKHHLVTNIARRKSTVLFVGYQARGTLGRQILDGAKGVRILGRRYPVRARVAQISGFSAHADRDELVQWLSGIKDAPRRVFVTHGEEESALSFGEFIKQNMGLAVSVPEYGEQVVLD